MKYTETSKGYFLTLNERKIMKLMIDEARERTDMRQRPGVIATVDRELSNLHLLIGDYITAYRQGRLFLSDIERCG